MTETDMVHEHIDTIDALMAHYVAGSLPEPARALVESHLEMKPDNRSLVGDLERLAGEALESTPASPIGDRDAKLAAIFGSKAPASPPRLPSQSRRGLFSRKPYAISSVSKSMMCRGASAFQASRNIRPISTAARSA